MKQANEAGSAMAVKRGFARVVFWRKISKNIEEAK
jgi:hypothetical protein